LCLTARGGTGDELDAPKNGAPCAAPVRLSDDVGVAMAEAIRTDPEGRPEEIPPVFLGRIAIVAGKSSAQDIRARSGRPSATPAFRTRKRRASGAGSGAPRRSRPDRQEPRAPATDRVDSCRRASKAGAPGRSCVPER